jgi:flagellin
VEGKIQLTNDNVGTTAIELGGADLAAVGLDNVDVNAAGSAALPAAEEQLQDAIQAIASARAQNGADQSVLGYRAELASASKSNYESAVSKIMDVDVAEESTQLARWNTLVQAGTAMIAQANGSTQSALTLLR